MAGNPIINFRVSPEMMQWLDDYVSEHGYKDRSALMTTLVTALREGRMKVYPRAGASGFPAIEVQPGVTPEHPLLICLSPTYSKE